MKKRFTEEQIIGILKEAEAGLKPAALCRRYGISEASYYNWKAKFGGMTVSEAQRLKELEQENNKFKRLLAESMLDNAALKDLLARKLQARRPARSSPNLDDRTRHGRYPCLRAGRDIALAVPLRITPPS
ncbi:transposase [Burkholderia ambifaria]|jgi:transposase-like protein|uniref:transposase n=1 Tax=Burkholderia TaxID=32008 RepID=UPI001ABB41E2